MESSRPVYFFPAVCDAIHVAISSSAAGENVSVIAPYSAGAPVIAV
jgi:hypothetical protein